MSVDFQGKVMIEVLENCAFVDKEDGTKETTKQKKALRRHYQQHLRRWPSSCEESFRVAPATNTRDGARHGHGHLDEVGGGGARKSITTDAVAALLARPQGDNTGHLLT